MGKTSSNKDEFVLKSLPLLQDRIKKDPGAYKDEFNLQFEHFHSSLEIFAASPQKPEKSFHELVMFVAHTSPYFDGRVDYLVDVLLTSLSTHCQTIHPLTRRTIVNALLLLRSKQIVPLMRLLPLFFQLLETADKSLRSVLLNFISKDITNNKLLRSGASKDELQEFLLNELKLDGRSKRAVRLTIDLYRRDAWREKRMVNAMADCCFSSCPKVALTAVNFMLGNCSPLIVDEETDDEGEAKNNIRAPIGSKKLRSKAKRLEREKENAKKKEERKEKRRNFCLTISGGGILDSLFDASTFAEKLFHRVASTKLKDSLQLKLALMNLISRLIARYQLVLLNFYPFIQRFITPKQKQITTILAVLSQASHELVPPEDLHPVMRHIMDQFIADFQTPEVIAVGLNAVREICSRAPLALTEDMLASMSDFRHYKNKSVVAGARSLINLYRDIYPELLHKRLRGKTAAMEVSSKSITKPEFGAIKAVTSIPGLDLLKEEDSESASSDDEVDDTHSGDLSNTFDDASSAASDSNDDGDESDEERTYASQEEGIIDDDNNGESEDEETRDSPEEFTTKRRKVVDGKMILSHKTAFDPTINFISDRDFKRLKKIQQRGTTAFNETANTDSEGEDIGNCEVVRPEDLASGIKKKGRDYRISLMQKGKEDRATFTQRNKERSRLTTGSLPNSVQKRNKPLMMVKQKRMIKAKKHLDVASKLSSIRKHIKTIKMDTGKKKKYRRN